MSLSFRIDDVCPEMDWDRFEKFLKLLAKYGIKPLLGVVPDNQDSMLKVSTYKVDFWDTIRNLQQEGYMIAMHGYNHVYTTSEKGIFPVNDRSEFAGVPYEDQLIKIQKGKQILADHGIETKVFMAPAHSFDENTIQALKKCKFQYITDGYARDKFKYDGMIYLPICNSIRRVKAISRRWRNITVVVHTNSLNKLMMDRYEKICSEISKSDLVGFHQLIIEESLICVDESVFNLGLIKYDWILENLVSAVYCTLSRTKRSVMNKLGHFIRR